MPHRRRRELIETRKGRIKAPFTVPESAGAVDVSLRLREVVGRPYKIYFDPETKVWIAIVIDWQRAA